MRIAIKFDEDGTFEVATDEPCEVYTISDHTPGDRVYQLGPAHQVGSHVVDEWLGDDAIGHAGDDKHASAIEAIDIDEPTARQTKH
jgi:hypothetical protein